MSKRPCLQSPLGNLLPIHMNMYLGVLPGHFLGLVAQRHQTGHVLPWPPRPFSHKGQAVKCMDPQSRDLLFQGSTRWCKPCACAVVSTCPAEGPLSRWCLGMGVMNHVLGQCCHVSHTIHFLHIRGLEISQRDAVHSLRGCWTKT